MTYPAARQTISPTEDWQVVEGVARSLGETIDPPVGEEPCLAWGVRETAGYQSHYDTAASRAVPFVVETRDGARRIEPDASVRVLGPETDQFLWFVRSLHKVEKMRFIGLLDETGCQVQYLAEGRYTQVAIRDGDNVTLVGNFVEAPPSAAGPGFRLRGLERGSPRRWLAYVLRGTRAQTIGRFGPGFWFYAFTCLGISFTAGFLVAILYHFVVPK